MEEFFNLIHQWCVPTKHAGMFPPKVEKMLNKDACQFGIWHEPSVLGYAYMQLLRRILMIKELRISAIRSLIYVIVQSGPL